MSTVAVAIVCAVCIRAGFWQLDRFSTRSAVAEMRTSRHDLSELDSVAVEAEEADYRRVRLTGRYRAVAVSTGGIPFSRNGYAALGILDADHGPDVIINRGWIPSPGFERYLELPTEPVTVEGILLAMPEVDVVDPIQTADGHTLWPQARESFLGAFSRGAGIPYSSLAKAHGVESPLVVIAGPELEDLEERSTRSLPAGGYTTYLKVFHHLEYAIQWFSFAAIALGLWLFYGWRRGRS